MNLQPPVPIRLAAAGVLVGLLVLAGCAGTPPPDAALDLTPTARTGVFPGSTTPTAPDTSGHHIADDFPLAEGWPPDSAAEPGDRYGLIGPARDLPPVPFVVCGQTFEDRPHGDRLRTAWTNVEDYRNRQLTTYAHPDAADGAVRAFLDFYRACPHDDGDDGDPFSAVIRVRPVAAGAGEKAWAVVRTYEFDGQPALGLEVLLVLRVGSAVLVDTTASEGGGGPDQAAQVQGQIDRQHASAGQVISAMCAATDATCR